MIFSLSVWAILALIVIIGILMKYIVSPYSIMLFYKKQGAVIHFVPFSGIIFKYLRDIPKTKDSFYYEKQEIAKNPNIRLAAHNFGSSAILLLVDPTIIKSFYGKQDLYIKNPRLVSLHKRLIGSGLFIAEGALWKKHRKLILILHFDS